MIQTVSQAQFDELSGWLTNLGYLKEGLNPIALHDAYCKWKIKKEREMEKE